MNESWQVDRSIVVLEYVCKVAERAVVLLESELLSHGHAGDIIEYHVNDLLRPRWLKGQNEGCRDL